VPPAAQTRQATKLLDPDRPVLPREEELVPAPSFSDVEHGEGRVQELPVLDAERVWVRAEEVSDLGVGVVAPHLS